MMTTRIKCVSEFTSSTATKINCPSKVLLGDQSLKSVIRFDVKRRLLNTVISNTRHVSARVDLPNGRYAIVPSTSDPEKEGAFNLTVYFDCQKSEMKFTLADDPNFKWDHINEDIGLASYPDDLKLLLKYKSVFRPPHFLCLPMNFF